MVTRLSAWETAVRKRRAAIQRAMRLLKSTRSVTMKKRLAADLANMMYYGIMNRHKQHWHKINGIWYKNSVRTKRAY